MNPQSYDPNPLQRPPNKARRLINPYLHQLPALPNGVTPSSPKAPDTDEDDFFDSFREIPDSGTRSKKGLEAIARRIAENLSSFQEEPESSKSIRMRVANLLQRSPECVKSNIVNGNVVENLPKMKSKKLKDRIILLKKVARQMDNYDKPVVTEGPEQHGLKSRRLRAMSSVPDILDDGKPKSLEFTEVLKDFLFRKKKKSLILLTDRSDTRVETSQLPSLPSCTSPDISGKCVLNSINIADIITDGRKKKNKRSSSDRVSPHILTQGRGSKPVKSPYNSQRSENETKQDFANLHKRVHSALPVFTDEIKIERNSKMLLLKGSIKTVADEVIAPEPEYLYSMEDFKLDHQVSKQTFDFEKNVASRGGLLNIRQPKMKTENICATDRPKKRKKSQPSLFQKKDEDQRAIEIENFRISTFKKLQNNIITRTKYFERQNRLAF